MSSFDVATFAWNGKPIQGNSASINAHVVGVNTDAVFTLPTKGVTNYVYTGGLQSFYVTACTTSVYISALGAEGGAGEGSGTYVPAGQGGQADATIPTNPNDTLVVVVGGQGAASAAGYNGGGSPSNGPSCGSIGISCGGGGGGASDVRQDGSGLSNRVVVGGGGGGGGGFLPSQSQPGSAGGNGGGLDGQSGLAGSATLCQDFYKAPYGGSGGTQSSGNALGQGGGGNEWCTVGLGDTFYSGGGGGGYYGGDGGGYGGGGGGGSGYTEPGAKNVYEGVGGQNGNGFVSICWGYSTGECFSTLQARLKLRRR